MADAAMTVGRDRLFPAIEAAPGAVVVATGTSCRQQIFHGAERDAWHPVQLVREALAQVRGPALLSARERQPAGGHHLMSI